MFLLIGFRFPYLFSRSNETDVLLQIQSLFSQAQTPTGNKEVGNGEVRCWEPWQATDPSIKWQKKGSTMTSSVASSGNGSYTLAGGRSASLAE